MIRLTLAAPEERFREQILAYRTEFLEAGDHMAGCAGLDRAPSFERWLQAVRANSREETVGRGLVPASNYLAIRLTDHRLVGFIDVRHRFCSNPAAISAIACALGSAGRAMQRRCSGLPCLNAGSVECIVF